MATDYELTAARLLRANARNHEAWNDWGMGLYNEALTLPSDVAAPMFAEAAIKLAVACDLSPQTALYQSNFADALFQQAVRSPDAVALPLFREAGEVYERLTRLTLRSSLSWYLAAVCYSAQAKRVEVNRCEPLYEAAYVRYAVATDLDPRNEFWNGWGAGLMDHAGRVGNADSPRLAMEAAAKFERAAELDPDNANLFYNQSVALTAVAEYAPNAPGVDRWLSDAYVVLTEAISLSPDTALHWRSRARVLMLQARRARADKRDAILVDADAQCAIAHRLAPDDYAGLLDWGCVCGERARYAEDVVVAISHAEEAAAKYEASARIKPDAAHIWLNWAIVCYFRASDEPERCTELLAEASEKLIVAKRIDPENSDATVWWVYILIALSRGESETNAAPLLAQAEEKARHALRLKPDSPNTHIAVCDALARRADREADPKRRAALFAEATANAGTADALRPGIAAYSRASIAALTGDEAGCEQALREAVAGNHLSNRRRVRTDEDFASVRNAPWFRELFGSD